MAHMTDTILFKSERQELSAAEFKKATGPSGALLGIDYGSVRIGLALSDEKRERATPFKIISKIRELDDIVPAKGIKGFVIGLPLQTDGKEGQTAQNVRLFAARLTEKFHLPVLWIDERYSSLETEEYLRDSLFMRPDARKKVLDSHVAARLLERAFKLMK